VILEAARARLPKRVPVSAFLYEGIPADQILSEVNTGGYDLIVLAAAAGGDLKHRILGSVSSKVAWNAPCSVLLVHVND
jgi:nucleotide-binding universal stress UspA family protein